MLNPFANQPTLELSLDQTTLFLHPTPCHCSSSLNSDPCPSDDQLLSGSVKLNLPTSRRIESNGLRVKLESRSSYNAGGSWHHEEDVGLKIELKMGKGEMLEAGEHTYGFSFIVPANSAEYHKSDYGRTNCFLSASLEGAGIFGSALKSRSIPVFLVGNPASHGDLPETFNELLAGYTEDLGPIRVNLSSPYLTVSALVLFDITLPSPPDVQITEVTGFVRQNFNLHYKRPDTIVSPPHQWHSLFKAVPPPRSSCSSDDSPYSRTPPLSRNSSASSSTSENSASCEVPLPGGQSLLNPRPLPFLVEGREWNYRRLSRIPRDDKVRPTTLLDSKTRIKVDHVMGVQIKYKVKGGQERAATIKRKVHITSCCALCDNIRLPSYQHNNLPTSKQALAKAHDCQCTFTFEEMIIQEEDSTFVNDQEDIGAGPAWSTEADPLTKTPAMSA